MIEIRRADTDEVIDTRIPTLSEQQVELPGLDTSNEEDDDFGGAQARAGGPKLEIVTSSTGGEVAHMPDDDEGEAPDPGALGDLAPPKKPAKAKGRAPRKAK